MCKGSYEPLYSTLQPTCNKPKCMAKHAENRRNKATKAKNRKFDKEVRDKDLRWHIKTLQTEFNKFIRLRDSEEPCISCQRFHSGQIHAGHYLSVGARPELRFEESNCHAQCKQCNMDLSGNLIFYRIHLWTKIGLEKVEWLEGPHEPKKYSVEDLKVMIKDYRARVRMLSSQQSSTN